MAIAATKTRLVGRTDHEPDPPCPVIPLCQTYHPSDGVCRHLGFARVRPGRPSPNSRPLHHHPVQRQVLHLRHRRFLPGLRRRLDLASRGHARASRHGPRHHSPRRPLLPVCCREHRGAAQSRHQHDMEQDPRPEFPRLQMGRRRDRRLVRWGRVLQCHRSGSLSGSHRRQAVAGLRFLFRLHPAGPTRPQDRQAHRPERQARGHRDQLRSVGHDLSRRLVLPAGHPWQLLSGRRLRLQHPRGPRQESDRSLPRPHGPRHAPRRRQALRRLRRPRHRPRPLRPARPGRWRAEVLLPLRSRPRQGRRQRAGHPPAAVEGRLARRRRQLQGRHV